MPNRQFLWLTWKEWVLCLTIAGVVSAVLFLAFPDKRAAKWISIFIAGPLLVEIVPVVMRNWATEKAKERRNEERKNF